MEAKMRKGFVCLLIIALAGPAFAAYGGTSMVSKTAVQRLDELNRILDEILEGLEAGALGLEELTGRIEEAFTAFENVLAAMPVAGVLFSDVFGALYDILYALNDAADIIDTGMALSPYSLYLAFADARWAKDSLRWSVSGGLIQKQLECARGRALVMVYLGFDCHALRAKLNELLAAGVCVTVGWQEPPCYVEDPNVAFSGPTATQLFDCLGFSYTVGPMFELDSLVYPGARGFCEYHTLGDPDADCHVPQLPGSPHASYVDSTLAIDIVQGSPTRYDPNHVFSVGDVLRLWYKVADVCGRVEAKWTIYSLAGNSVYEDTSVLDPADFHTDCLSSFSSAGWMSLDAGSFGTAGAYTAELWLGGTHCASHTFQMAGPANRPPYVHNDVLTIDEDFVLEVKERGVFGNDLDPDGDPLAATLVKDAQHGTLTLEPDGTFTYVPEADYFGVDWFTYEASDPAGLSASGEVTILVNPIDDPPIANDDVYEIAISPDGRTWALDVPELGWSEIGTFVEDDVFIIIPPPGPLLNDFDSDIEPLTLRLLGPHPPMMEFFPDGSMKIPVDVPDLPKSYLIPYTVADPAGLEATGEIMIRIVLQEGTE
jgi:hypothetical protein